MNWGGIAEGFDVALAVGNLGWVFVGVLIGTIIGVLPGLGPTATIALLLPITYGMEPASAIILLAGIYYGSMYGGTITAVLLRVPGEAASVITALDGYEMAKQGRAGAALGISAVGSFIGGFASTLGLFVLAPTFAVVALAFGPPEYAAIAVAGLFMACLLQTSSTLRGWVSVFLGLMLAAVGRDPVSGETRYTFGMVELSGGLSLVAVAMGLFGIGELVFNVTQTEKAQVVLTKLRNVIPSKRDLTQSAGPIARGSILGFLIGVLPGGGGAVSSMASYALEKRVSKNRSQFGKGAIEGVAGPETANNASATSAFIPLLTLGLPSNSVLAVIFGALLLQGVSPGPSLVTDHPEVFWGVLASMLIGNVMLLILNIPLVSAFVQLLRIRVGLLTSGAVAVTFVGAFSIQNSVFDMYVLVAFGLVGYFMRLVNLPLAPLILAFVLGPILESAVRQSLLISGGDPTIFLTRPISASILAAILLLLGLSAIWGRRTLRTAPDSGAQ